MFFLQTGLGLFIKEALRIDRRALLLFFPALFSHAVQTIHEKLSFVPSEL